VIVAHVMGLPLEESILQLAPAAVAMVTAVGLAGRTNLSRLRRLLRRAPARDHYERRRQKRFRGVRPSHRKPWVETLRTVVTKQPARRAGTR
jgi:hypothetical protein